MAMIEPFASNFRELTGSIKTSQSRIIIGSTDGSTPSRGFIAEATKYAHENKLSIDVLINSNPNTSIYNDVEIKIMENDLFQCQEMGVDGVYFSANDNNKKIDIESVNTLIAASGGMEINYNDSFDELSDKESSIKWLNESGFDKIISENINQNDIDSDVNLQIVKVSSSDKQIAEIKDSNLANFIIVKK